MKTLFAFFCVIFFSGNAFSSPKDCGDQGRTNGTAWKCNSGQQQQQQRSDVSVNDVFIRNNRHIISYTPADINSKNGTYQYGGCTEDGFYHTDKSITRKCQDFKSASQGTWWRVRFGQAGNAEYVFKLTNGNPQLWVKFKQGTQTAEFTSPGAQQYAAVNGGGGQIAGRGIPQVPQSARNSACDQLSGKARAGCEAASGLLPNIGGLLKW